MNNPEEPVAMESAGAWSHAALVIAHPSHELRVHGWLQRSRPRVFVLTDGSGRTGDPRLLATTKVLDDVGAERGLVYGRFSDSEVYAALLKKDFPFFIQIAEDLAEEFIRNKIEYLVADSAEGYSATHDVCRLLANAAAEIARRRDKREIANYDFAVVGSPDECPTAIRDKAIWIRLDDEAFSRKISAARAYNAKLARDVEAAMRGEPFQGVRRFSVPQLAGEVDVDLTRKVLEALPGHPGIESTVKGVMNGVELEHFRIECLRPIETAITNHAESEMPFYELYGEKVVAAGHYQTTIRYSDHFLPLAAAVWDHVHTY